MRQSGYMTGSSKTINFMGIRLLGHARPRLREAPAALYIVGTINTYETHKYVRNAKFASKATDMRHIINPAISYY